MTTATVDALWFINDLARIHLTGERVGGRLSVVEFSAPAGDMPPLHRHQREDELFYVLEGQVTIHQPGRRTVAEAGNSVLAERGVPHAYEVSKDGPARFLVIATPAGFEEFVAQVSRPAEAVRLPDPSAPDAEKLAAIAARFGIDLLGPPGTLP
jgi:quercetin dioxygenase-like cupin family protein